MSGGSSKKKTEKKEEPAPAQATYQQAAFMPGMDSMIAQQLGMGGYGDQSSLLSYMNSIQTPMQMPVLPTPGTPSPTQTTSTAKPKPGTPDWWQDMLDRGSKALGPGAYMGRR